jgi:uncharacterized protein YutE (UPF0331/DUF86 family)
MDKNELNDIRFLVKYLNITSIEQAFDIIRNYYPDNMIKPKTQYMLMEILNS